MPERKLVGPEVTSFGVVPIREDGVAGPDGSNVETAVGVFDKQIVFGTSIVGFISISSHEHIRTWTKHSGQYSRIRCIVRVRDIKSRVYKRNEATAFRVQLVQEFLTILVRPMGLIVLEVTVTTHVVDIDPDICAR